MKTKKVMEYCNNGLRLECIKHMDGSENPYRLYMKWYDKGWHRHQLEKYADAASAMYHAFDMIRVQGGD